MSKSLLAWWVNPPTSLRYLVAALSAIAALVAGGWVDTHLASAPFVSLFLCAIMFAAWFGGAGPGFLATVLSVLAFDYFFVAPPLTFALSPHEVPRVILFALAALFVLLLTASQRRATESFRRARDELQGAVEKLQNLNTALHIESAERQRSEAYLAEAQRLSRTGSIGWKIASGEAVWSEETYRILGVEPGVEPTREVMIRSVHPNDRERIAVALETVL